jgi:hypothetical protein
MQCASDTQDAACRDSYFAHTSGNTGYSGVATFCRRSVTVPLNAEEGLTGFLSAPRGG